MFRLHARIDRILTHLFGKFLVAELTELQAGNDLILIFNDTQLLGNRDRCILVVTGNHDHTDPRALTFLDCRFDLRANGVNHARQPEESHPLLQRFT